MTLFQRLSHFDLSMIVISLVIGMGIFATPTTVASGVTNPFLYFGVWIFGGVISICGALTFAEIGARYPTIGGFYKTLSFCFHPALAFMINWVLVISNAASVAAVSIMGASYIVPIIMPLSLQSNTGAQIVSICSVLILYFINLFGLKVGTRAQNILTLSKIFMILVICTAIFKTHAPVIINSVYLPPNHGSLYNIGKSLIAVFFTYGGYQQTINFGGDSINAKENLPKAIFGGMAVVIALYLLINYAYYSSLGIAGIQHEHKLAAALAGLVFGTMGYKVFSLLMFISVLAFINVNILANPRIYHAMAEDGILPARFKKVNPKSQVQEFGLSFFVAAILIILCFARSFEKLMTYVMFFDTIGLSVAAFCIFILRRRMKSSDNTGIYTIGWYPLIPLIFIITYLFITLFIFIENPMATLICLCTFAIGLMIYFITKISRKPNSIS